MIVDKERKVIYLHNPKCGGTFLRELYIEKYGDSEATKWWKTYTCQYDTDLGHITYSDLPRFIPQWREYRMVMMIRNPYNRFYSAVKETLANYERIISIKLGEKIEVRLHGWIYSIEYNQLSRIRRIYDVLKICTGTYPLDLPKQADPETICKHIFSIKRAKQDFFIRNKKIPWLNPQSYFIGKNVEVLRYESESDWKILLEIFGLSEYQNRLSIAKDYTIPDNIREMIRNLYPEDQELFEMYQKKN